MGQLEKYGLYVLVVVIVMILGVAIWGEPAAAKSDLAVVDINDATGGNSEPLSKESRPDWGASLFGGKDKPADGGIGTFVADPDRTGKGAPEDAKADPVNADGPKPDVKAVPVSPPAARRHTIRSGDSPSAISARYYGTVRHYQLILDANPGLDERRMPIGKEIVIPPAPTVGALDFAGIDTDGPITQRVEPVTATPPATLSRRHRVAEGETLSAIAIRYYQNEQRWVRIAEANPGIDPNRLRPNTELVIPVLAADSARPIAEASAARTVPAGAALHRILEGETLTTLSRRYYGNDNGWQKILDANPGINERRLKVGTDLVVPDVVRGRTL